MNEPSFFKRNSRIRKYTFFKNDLQILNKEKDQEVEIAQIEKEREIKCCLCY